MFQKTRHEADDGFYLLYYLDSPGDPISLFE